MLFSSRVSYLPVAFTVECWVISHGPSKIVVCLGFAATEFSVNYKTARLKLQLTSIFFICVLFVPPRTCPLGSPQVVAVEVNSRF